MSPVQIITIGLALVFLAVASSLAISAPADCPERHISVALTQVEEGGSKWTTYSTEDSRKLLAVVETIAGPAPFQPDQLSTLATGSDGIVANLGFFDADGCYMVGLSGIPLPLWEMWVVEALGDNS